LIHALQSYDFLVLYPLHPLTVAKFREAFKASGAKSDPLDTDQILQILTKHLELLRPLNPDTVETRLLGRLSQDRRKTVDLRTSHIEGLSAALKEYFPQALEAVGGNLASRLAGDFLQKWPTLEAFQQAKPSTLKRFLYGHNVRSPQRIEKVLELAKMAQPLTTDPAIVESGRRLAQMHAQAIQTLNPIIADYDHRIEQVFNQHPEVKLFNQLPGAGPALAPRLLAFFGTDRARYAKANNVQSFCGVAPVTRSSGNTKAVFMRRACPKFARQTFHEFARLSIATSQWARNYVDYYKGKGKKSRHYPRLGFQVDSHPVPVLAKANPLQRGTLPGRTQEKRVYLRYPPPQNSLQKFFMKSIDGRAQGTRSASDCGTGAESV
jgi:transposase